MKILDTMVWLVVMGLVITFGFMCGGNIENSKMTKVLQESEKRNEQCLESITELQGKYEDIGFYALECSARLKGCLGVKQ